MDWDSVRIAGTKLDRIERYDEMLEQIERYYLSVTVSTKQGNEVCIPVGVVQPVLPNSDEICEAVQRGIRQMRDEVVAEARELGVEI